MNVSLKAAQLNPGYAPAFGLSKSVLDNMILCANYYSNVG